MISLNCFNVGDNFGSIVITKHTEKQVYFKSTCSNAQETHQKIFKDKDGCEVIFIANSVLDFFDVSESDDFFKYADYCEKFKGFKGKDKNERYYSLRADAKVKGGEIVENHVETQEVLSVEYSKALSLNRKIKANAQILADMIFELGSQLKEMRDGKLYKELGYKNFEEYCKVEIGFTSRQGRDYISIAENLGDDEKWKSTSTFGVQKMALISKLNESQREQLQETVDLEDITVKQLQEEVKKLKAENTELKETVSSAKGKNSEQITALNEQIEQLENQIKELENRPIDVVAIKEDTSTSREISNLKKEIKAKEESVQRLLMQYNLLEDEMTTATQNAYRQGLEASKNNTNANQDDVFNLVTENLENAFYKYFEVITITKSKHSKWAERIKSTLTLFDKLKGEVNYE